MLATPACWAVAEFATRLESPATTRKSPGGCLVTVPSASTQWAAVRMCEGSRIDPPVCLTSVVTTTFEPSQSLRLSWYGGTFLMSSDGFWYGP